MVAAYRYAATGKYMPWALELHRYCQLYNALPENQNGGVLATATGPHEPAHEGALQ